MDKTEWKLWALAGVLCVLVCVAAVCGAPSFAPVSVVYSDGGASASASSTAAVSERINLNTATREQLMTVNGIGEKLADSILLYRERYGGFHSVEELLLVEGIGEQRYAQWKDYFTV